MNLKEQYTAETGKTPTYAIHENDTGANIPSHEYVQWLETKYLEQQSPVSDADYLKAREEIEDVLIRLWKLEPEKADLMTCQILNGFEREGLRIMPKQKQSTAPEVSEESDFRKDIARIRNYFGENDETPFEHWAYDFLDRLMKQQLDDRIGCFHCGKRMPKDALYCPHCEKAA